MNIAKDSPVAIVPCESYDPEEVFSALRRCFSEAGFGEEQIRGKRVVVKANLVMAKSPEFAATSHPAVVEACARLLDSFGAAKITLADSPGGPFTASALAGIYKTCGMTALEERSPLTLNRDFAFDDVFFQDGRRLKKFHVIRAVSEADVVINLCKLKTHSLTGMSGAVKNLFGIIPGVEKFEMHATFSTVETFSEALNDLNAWLIGEKPCFSLCDGVVGMEGNGPTHGVPQKAGLLLASVSPFALDIAAERIIGCAGETRYLDVAAERGYVSRDFADLNVTGMRNPPLLHFQKPDGSTGKFLRNLPNFMGGRFASLFEARPEIQANKCVGCGVCVRSCPRKVVSLKERGKGKKVAVIARKNCIRCYCCQELCPIGAVKTRQNPLVRLIH